VPRQGLGEQHCLAEWIDNLLLLQQELEQRWATVKSISSRETYRMLLASLLAERRAEPFNVGDALQSMTPEYPLPRAIDDPSYSTKYKRLKLAIHAGLLDQKSNAEGDRRSKRIVPTDKLRDLFADHAQIALRCAEAFFYETVLVGEAFIVISIELRFSIYCFSITASAVSEGRPGSRADDEIAGVEICSFTLYSSGSVEYPKMDLKRLPAPPVLKLLPPPKYM
jgi:hypothetical protein